MNITNRHKEEIQIFKKKYIYRIRSPWHKYACMYMTHMSSQTKMTHTCPLKKFDTHTCQKNDTHTSLSKKKICHTHSYKQKYEHMSKKIYTYIIVDT